MNSIPVISGVINFTVYDENGTYYLIRIPYKARVLCDFEIIPGKNFIWQQFSRGYKCPKEISAEDPLNFLLDLTSYQEKGELKDAIDEWLEIVDDEVCVVRGATAIAA